MKRVLFLLYNAYDFFRLKYYLYRFSSVAKSIGKDFKLGSKSYSNSNTLIGNNVTINGIEIQGNGTVKIGNHCQIAKDCLILTQNHNIESDALPFGKDNIIKDVIIKDNVWIGQRVTILPGVVIEEGAVIQAGSTVIKNVPKCAIAGGHPAKVFRYRDVDRYENLKKGEKYY